MVFTEYEQIPKKKADGIFTTAILPENIDRNRVKEVIPYEENRVELVPTKENNTGYINASHIKVTMGKTSYVQGKELWLKEIDMSLGDQSAQSLLRCGPSSRLVTKATSWPQ